MRRKLFSWILLSALSLFIACCLMFGITAYRYAVDEHQQQLSMEAEFIATWFEEDSQRSLRQVTELVAVRVTHIAADGRVLYDSLEDSAVMTNQGEKPEVMEALAYGKGDSRRYSDTWGKKAVFAAIRLQDNTVLRLADTPHLTMLLFSRLFTPVLVALLTFLLLSFLLAIRVSRSIIEPIVQIDLMMPEERDVYPELLPLVRRINTQNRQIYSQVETLKAEHERQDCMRREFTANVTHELKTPLTSISGFAELMRDGLVKAEDVPRFAGSIYDESQRLYTLVEDIIKLSRMDSRVDMPEKAPVNLLEVCQMVASHLEPAARRKEVTLQVEGQALTVFGAESILYEMVYNLCDNAIKYNRPGGLVTVGVKKVGAMSVLTVHDTGIGIPPEEHSRIFERFYRVDKSHSKEMGGTGLGLSIVKHSATFHMAEIEVESTLGEGTTITVKFPATTVESV